MKTDADTRLEDTPLDPPAILLLGDPSEVSEKDFPDPGRSSFRGHV